MMRLETVVTLFPDLDAAELTAWIEQRWVLPEAGEDDTWIFHEIDLARVQLIYDLRRALNTPEETVSLVLSLVDQVYELRCALRAVEQALAAQSPDVRNAVLAALKARDRDH